MMLVPLRVLIAIEEGPRRKSSHASTQHSTSETGRGLDDTPIRRAEAASAADGHLPAPVAAMSKKKAVTTMTLKDFHGGSIPSELPLPSAPGVTPRPADRTVASASPVAAAVARPRVPVASPAAAAAAAAMPSFLTNPSRIGRHFDEDERTPFEPTTPRRPAPSPTSFAPAPVVAPTRSGPGNAWGPKKEASSAPSPVGHAPASAGDQIWSATRIAQASAVEKVISGRWHPPKPTSPPAPVSVPVLETPVAPPEIERPRSVGVRELDSGVERGAAPVRPASHEGRIGEGRAGEVPERPKLKLLPRSKPIEDPEQRPTYVEAKQVHQVQVTAGLMKAEDNHDLHQNARATETGVLGADAESRVAERPRLNLKPRSYVTGQSDEIAVKESFMTLNASVTQFSMLAALLWSLEPYMFKDKNNTNYALQGHLSLVVLAPGNKFSKNVEWMFWPVISRRLHQLAGLKANLQRLSRRLKLCPLTLLLKDMRVLQLVIEAQGMVIRKIISGILTGLMHIGLLVERTTGGLLEIWRSHRSNHAQSLRPGVSRWSLQS
ncbi:uncharacterized protein [Zea mays]|uniref:uncharacterized protein isoform X3 n=1 Tax=Zea mays TaxID=4577 RepID=UPI0009A9F282|nr:uncharacterized protein LOC100383319 isoform X3 [Zea mays]|eukprot:XP_008668404.2 uncharacterized protein LOC100383319 isoform X3 [Zea mays]